jgi:universal stress protein A
MSHYKKVLVAIDGSDESDTIVKKAVEIAAANKAVLSAVLVFEPLLGSYSFELNMADFETLQKQHNAMVAGAARKSLAKHGIAAGSVHFLSGKAATEIKKLVAESSTDLLVIGSHGHSPIRAILGSTANAVLHGIGCDVLTVRV